MNQVMNQITRSRSASIGAFDAKAQLSRLLRAVEQGERFTITVPHRAEATQAVAAAVAALQAAPRIRGVSAARRLW